MSPCEYFEVDGEMVRAQVGPNFTDADREALAEVVRAAKAKLAKEPPSPITVTCPACGSEPGAFCRNTSGRVTSVHSQRCEVTA